jgi:hypothetical protein
VTDSDFTKNMIRVNDLTSDFETLVNQIKRDTKMPLKNSIELRESVLNDKIVTMLNETNNLSSFLNQTNALFDLNNKTQNASKYIKRLNDEITLENSRVTLMNLKKKRAKRFLIYLEN